MTPFIRLTPAQFKAIQAKSEGRKASRAERRKTLPWGQEVPLAGPKRARKANSKGLGMAGQVKAIRARLLPRQGGGLWSLAVRKRDGNRCVMCGKVDGISSHHWLFRRSHSKALSVDINNGVSLCYSCHLGRIHRDGDGDFSNRLFHYMEEKVGPVEMERMRRTACNPVPLDLDWWKQAEIGLRYYLEGRKEG